MFEILAIGVIAGPVLLLAVLGLPPLVGWRVSESFLSGMSKFVISLGFAALLGVVILQFVAGNFWGAPRVLRMGDWVLLEQAHFHFRLEFIFDWLSIPFAMLCYVLCGLISAFAANYMHREPGFHRFFFLFAMFLLGMILAALAGSIETLFFGWELVGLSSALLVAFFQERTAPVRNGLRVWTVYRLADAAFLVAAAALHHLAGEGELLRLLGSGGELAGDIRMTSGQALFVGSLLIVAAAGKSALVPFSGWLPRAMEGPTPSSAVFYGALSIHLGAFLLLRIGPLLDHAPLLSSAVLALGLATALFGAVAGRVQSDMKSALAFASLTQVGLIVAEIGMGWRYLPLAHLIGHACLRTLQLLRAPSLLRDYQVLENALGQHLSNRRPWLEIWLPPWLSTRIYRWGLERGYLDVALDQWIVNPCMRLFRWLDQLERTWTDWLAGRATDPSSVRSPSGDGQEQRP